MINDKTTFLRLLNEHKGIIMTICNAYCLTRDDKEDLAQEITYNLWKAFSNYKPVYKFSTWLYRVALNVAISFYRREKRQLVFHALDENLLVFEADDQCGDTDQHLVMLQRFIHELKEIDRSLLLLYLDDKSYRDIAGIMGISETNVATRLNRIKAALKTKFQTVKT